MNESMNEDVLGQISTDTKTLRVTGSALELVNVNYC